MEVEFNNLLIINLLNSGCTPFSYLDSVVEDIRDYLSLVQVVSFNFILRICNGAVCRLT